MRVAFADFISWDYRIDSVARMPLGGSQSAMCYLAQELARRGEMVSLINFTTTPGVYCGVDCRSLREPTTLDWLRSLDVLIVLNSTGHAHDLLPGRTAAEESLRPSVLRGCLAAGTRLVLWTQHAHDQPALLELTDERERDAYDAVVGISEWQRRHLVEHYGLDASRTAVLRNAIAPSFQRLFTVEDQIVAGKSRPPRIAYTSTPFRGLDVLLEVFPRIRAAVPGTLLDVFSSMRVYRVAPEQDEAQFGALYRHCVETDGVVYHGSVPQPELALALRQVSVFAYPNTFAETGCTAAMEALAAGCAVVTSELAALPETTAGLAHLIPILGDEQRRYKDRFVAATVAALRAFESGDRGALERRLRIQVERVEQEMTWSRRADEWVQWLRRLG